MPITREIYWNVGHGVVLPMYLLLTAAFCLMVRGFWKRLAHWRQGRPLNRFDCYDERISRMICDVFGQEKVFRVKDGGVFHALFFWAFLTLFAGTLLVMLQADYLTPVLKLNLLQGRFTKGFHWYWISPG